MAQIPDTLSMLALLADRLRTEGSVNFAVRVKPGAKKTEITAVLSDGSVKISVKSPPQDGEANAELLRLLAGVFAVPLDGVELLSGGGARLKRVRVTLPR